MHRRHRRIHRIPERAEATGIIVQPALGALYVVPDDEAPHRFAIHHEGRHSVEARRQRHVVTAVGGLTGPEDGNDWRDGGKPSYRVAALESLEAMTGEAYRIPNVHGDGRICWAGTRVPDDLQGFDTVFWSSPFNDHLAQGRFPGWRRDRHTATPETLWRRHYARLQNRPDLLNIARTCEDWVTREPSPDTPLDDEAWLNQGSVCKWARGRWSRRSFTGYGQSALNVDTYARRAERGHYGASFRHAENDCNDAISLAWEKAGKHLGKKVRTWGMPVVTDRRCRQKMREGANYYTVSWDDWKTLPREIRSAIALGEIRKRKVQEALRVASEIVRPLYANAKAVGCRLGARDLPSDSRTKKQAEIEAEVMAGLDALAVYFPMTAERNRRYYFHLIEWHRATGKVRARRTELRADFMAPYEEAEENGKETEHQKRLRRVANFFGGGWQATDPEDGSAINAQPLADVMDLKAYYLGPRVDAIFLTVAPSDLGKIPSDYRAVPTGIRAAAGAFAARQGNRWVLAFPHRDRGVADCWRATCALDGTDLCPAEIPEAASA